MLQSLMAVDPSGVQLSASRLERQGSSAADGTVVAAADAACRSAGAMQLASAAIACRMLCIMASLHAPSVDGDEDAGKAEPSTEGAKPMDLVSVFGIPAPEVHAKLIAAGLAVIRLACRVSSNTQLARRAPLAWASGLGFSKSSPSEEVCSTAGAAMLWAGRLLTRAIGLLPSADHRAAAALDILRNDCG